jgi:plasmid segregation protein ParM
VAARVQVGNLIASSAAASLRDRVGFVQQMLLAGGGALLFETEIARALPGVRVIDDPVYANAKGFLSLSAPMA